MPNDDSTPTESTPERRLQIVHSRDGAYLEMDTPEIRGAIGGLPTVELTLWHVTVALNAVIWPERGQS